MYEGGREDGQQQGLLQMQMQMQVQREEQRLAESCRSQRVSSRGCNKFELHRMR